jgi:hypothetical protein
MTVPWITLDFAPFFRSLEATHWNVRDGLEKNRIDSCSNPVGTVQRRHRLQNTWWFSALHVFDDAYAETQPDTMCIARRREAAPFNELLFRMIFLA